MSTTRNSLLLGAELRRLRGGRSLREIAKLSRQAPFNQLGAPISIATLSQAERGYVEPTLDTLATLAAVYSVPVCRFVELTRSKRFVQQLEPTLDDLAQAEERFEQEAKASDWSAALTVALHAEQLAAEADDTQALCDWRFWRAACLHYLGLNEAAIDILESLLHRDVPTARLSQVFSLLADVRCATGDVFLSEVLVDKAERCLPDEVPTDVTRQLQERRVRFRLLAAWADPAPAAAADIREAFRWVDSFLHELEGERRLALEIQRAQLHAFLDNRLLAVTQLEQLAEQANEMGEPALELDARRAIGAIERRFGHLKAAGSALGQAEQLMFVHGRDLSHDDVFATHVELAALAHEQEDGVSAQRHLRSCQRHHPFLSRRSPSVTVYERLLDRVKAA
ncbi:MAG: hypothetical protein AAF533_04165 [Acidobacteriota bacterium]